MREKTIPTNLSSKHEVCFMMKSAFKVMDTCLWYLDSGCLRHMTRDRSLFEVFESKKGGNVTFLWWEQITNKRERNHLSTWIARHYKCVVCRRFKSELVEDKSDMWSRLHGVILRSEVFRLEWVWKETHKWSQHSG